MTEIVNHSRSTALERSVKSLLGCVGGLNRFYVATTLALILPWYAQEYVQSAWKVSNSSVQYLREHKNQMNTEIKQPWGLDSKK